jgi:hypothetical protein
LGVAMRRLRRIDLHPANRVGDAMVVDCATGGM